MGPGRLIISAPDFVRFNLKFDRLPKIFNSFNNEGGVVRGLDTKNNRLSA